MPEISSTLMALIVVGLLLLVMRWVFSPSRPRGLPPVDATDARELGLLMVVATVPRIEAPGWQAQLGEAGIRASLSRRQDGRLDVLVFHRDAEKARAVFQR